MSAGKDPDLAVPSGATAGPDGTARPPRVPALSFFFPAHNEEANLEALVEEALAALPGLAEQFEIIAVDDGSRDRTPAIADELAARHPDVFRVVHHPTNYGYGAALRSGFRASRFAFIAFTDGDRQFKVADVGRLTERLVAAGPTRTSWSGSGSSAPIRSIRTALRAPATGWPTGSSSACGSATSTAPASSSGAMR